MNELQAKNFGLPKPAMSRIPTDCVHEDEESRVLIRNIICRNNLSYRPIAKQFLAFSAPILVNGDLK